MRKTQLGFLLFLLVFGGILIGVGVFGLVTQPWKQPEHVAPAIDCQTREAIQFVAGYYAGILDEGLPDGPWLDETSRALMEGNRDAYRKQIEKKLAEDKL